MTLNSFFKRALDIVTALFGLVLLSPLLLLISIVIKILMGKPILFRQFRPGYRACAFTVIKFRTMTVGDTAATHASDAGRLTRFGDFLRRFSLDELPQLWNVLIGEMSLVGPRPLLTEYLERYTPEQARRHNAKPGITGWAQVQGRQNIPFSRRLVLDVWYVDHQNFLLDLRIIFHTLCGMMDGVGVHSGQNVRDVDDVGLHPLLRKGGENSD
jgi:sugar transferase EpsL